jgi:uncharacterized membrane protein YfcA
MLVCQGRPDAASSGSWAVMGWGEALIILGAAAAAGALNVLVGGGSLITYPTLLALGHPPVLANVSNNLGIIPGNTAGVLAYRPLLAGHRSRLLALLPPSLLGGLSGAILLLALPATLFAAVVPLLIALASVLMALQPRIRAWIDQRHGSPQEPGLPLLAGVFLSGLYGGYFGAAQGVLLLAVMAVGLDEGLQRLNGFKNALVLSVNATAAVVFIGFSRVDWRVTALIAVGTAAGGWLGGRYGRRIPEALLRRVIMAAGLVVAAVLAMRLG